MFSALKHCMELRDAHIIRAVSSSEAMEALLARFAEIAAPGKGGPIILAALARIGTSACDWIDGELRIEISGDESSSKITVSSTIGAGFREKLFADTVLRVPLSEFSRGIARAPRLFEPLQVKESGSRIVLSVTQEVRKTSMPPPMVQLDASSFMPVPSMALPHMPAPQESVPRSSSAGPASRPGPWAPAATGAPKIVLRRRQRDTPKK